MKNKDCPMASKKISCDKELKTYYKPNLSVNEKFQESLEKDLLIELHGFLKKKLSLGTWKYYQIREKLTIKANEILERYKLEGILINIKKFNSIVETVLIKYFTNGLKSHLRSHVNPCETFTDTIKHAISIEQEISNHKSQSFTNEIKACSTNTLNDNNKPLNKLDSDEFQKGLENNLLIQLNKSLQYIDQLFNENTIQYSNKLITKANEVMKNVL